jgi:hypothetical protein
MWPARLMVTVDSPNPQETERQVQDAVYNAAGDVDVEFQLMSQPEPPPAPTTPQPPQVTNPDPQWPTQPQAGAQ